ncbi:hypothetical protein PENSPDRAFT_755170 [Peniophora sp. CONT]|nr:hypothetical protein PENSPDRAFT_755170 [Peniophora sp. CONT]
MAHPDYTTAPGLSDEDKKEAQKVRRWRHNVQREMLPTDEYLRQRGPLSIEIARPVDVWFKEIEAYDTMTIDHLAYSKIGKVMRHIVLLDTEALPQDVDDAFKFRKRARKLIDRWQTSLHRNPPHRSIPPENKAYASSSHVTDDPDASTDPGVQTIELVVGVPPTDSPLNGRDQPAKADLGVDGQDNTDVSPADFVLDIALPPEQDDLHVSAEHRLPSAVESSPSTEKPNETDAVGASPALESADASPGLALVSETPPSLADPDGYTQGKADEGFDDGSADDWVVIDVNVQMESVRIT